MTRREYLRLLAAAGLTPPAAAANAVNDDAAKRYALLFEEYDGQGIHRTATAGDEKSARWLAAQVKRYGVEPRLESFTLNRIDPQRCEVRIGGKRIEGLPIFDATFGAAGGEANGIRGRLGPLGSDAEIGLVELPPSAEYGPGYEKMRRESRHRALVFITKGARPGLSPINAPKFTEPYGPPVLQVGSEHSEGLKREAQQNSEAIVVIRLKRARARALNVTTTIEGGQSGLAPLVVMTPRSGWWRSTSERGGGLICWLEALRALAVKKPARTTHFVSSSGHELGHLGLESFIERRPGLVKQAHAWIHFGANIGAVGATNRLQAFDDELESIAVDAMTRAGIAIRDKAERGVAPLGEAGNIHRGGGRYLSLLCPGSPLFHHPADRWPDAVDISAVARYAEAFAGAAVRLANS